MTRIVGNRAIFTIGLITLIAVIITFCAAKLTKAAHTFKDSGNPELITNGEMLWESLTHHLVTSPSY